jgi:hypothetical protein
MLPKTLIAIYFCLRSRLVVSNVTALPVIANLELNPNNSPTFPSLRGFRGLCLAKTAPGIYSALGAPRLRGRDRGRERGFGAGLEGTGSWTGAEDTRFWAEAEDTRLWGGGRCMPARSGFLLECEQRRFNPELENEPWIASLRYVNGA